MVQRGQFLERPTLIPVGECVMEGMAHRGARRPPLLVLPPQPAQGGGMDHVIAAELVWAAARAGHPTVRFNHRGVGGSQGEPGTGGALVDDAEAALHLALENTSADGAVVAGLLSGAATALALLERLTAKGEASIAGLLLVSPSTIGPETIAHLELPFLVVLGEDEAREQRSAWSRVAQEAGGVLELVPGADARYQRNLPELGRWAVQFLSSLDRSNRGPVRS